MEIIEQIIEDRLTAPRIGATQRPFVVAVATGEVRDRLSEEFLRRWDAVKDFRGRGILRKIGTIFKRYGFPTSNWLVVKKYTRICFRDLRRSARICMLIWGLRGRTRRLGMDSGLGTTNSSLASVELFLFTHKSLGKFAASDAGLFMQNLILSGSFPWAWDLSSRGCCSLGRCSA